MLHKQKARREICYYHADHLYLRKNKFFLLNINVDFFFIINGTSDRRGILELSYPRITLLSKRHSHFTQFYYIYGTTFCIKVSVIFPLLGSM